MKNIEKLPIYPMFILDYQNNQSGSIPTGSIPQQSEASQKVRSRFDSIIFAVLSAGQIHAVISPLSNIFS
jgi:hypothetical protein